MSSKRAKAKTTKKRPQRATSNVFAMFDQSQIQEFKEAFNMIDQNRDGFIDKEDLHDMLASLGEQGQGCVGSKWARERLQLEQAVGLHVTWGALPVQWHVRPNLDSRCHYFLHLTDRETEARSSLVLDVNPDRTASGRCVDWAVQYRVT